MVGLVVPGSGLINLKRELNEITGAKYVVAVSNGTSCFKVSPFVLGVRSNDEVLIPPLTFVATANAVSHLGAIHFIDIESQSLGMSPFSLRKRLNAIAIKKMARSLTKKLEIELQQLYQFIFLDFLQRLES